MANTNEKIKLVSDGTLNEGTIEFPGGKITVAINYKGDVFCKIVHDHSFYGLHFSKMIEKIKTRFQQSIA